MIFSEARDRQSLKTATTGLTLSDDRVRRSVPAQSSVSSWSDESAKISRHLMVAKTRHDDNASSVPAGKGNVPQDITNVTEAEATASTSALIDVGLAPSGSEHAPIASTQPTAKASSSAVASSSLSPAPAGQVWVIRESSEQQSAPLLSEYVPQPTDTYTDLPGSPWKLVAGSSHAASLVVELIGAEQFAKEAGAKKVQDPFSTRQVHRPQWLAPLAKNMGIVEHAMQKPLNKVNATEQTLVESVENTLKKVNATEQAFVESVEDSPFVLQQVMPLVQLQKVKKIAAVVSSTGLFKCQMLSLLILVVLLIFFLIIDKVRKSLQEEEDLETSKPHGWWRQLGVTSWEAMPGVEYGESHQSDSNRLDWQESQLKYEPTGRSKVTLCHAEASRSPFGRSREVNADETRLMSREEWTEEELNQYMKPAIVEALSELPQEQQIPYVLSKLDEARCYVSPELFAKTANAFQNAFHAAASQNGVKVLG